MKINFFHVTSVYKSNANEHVFRKLMDELQTTMTIYRVWGSHLGSSQLFKQHLESRRRITEFVEKMQVHMYWFRGKNNDHMIISYMLLWKKNEYTSQFIDFTKKKMEKKFETSWQQDDIHTYQFHCRNHNSHTYGHWIQEKNWC